MASATKACNGKCPMCGDPGTSACGGCGEISYCSKACQESDWRFHKHICKTSQTMKTRPSEDMRRVLLFPADGTKPEFVWRNIRGGVEPDRPEFDDRHFIGACEIDESSFTEVSNDYRIELRYDDMSFGCYPINQAAKTATAGMCGHSWCGPLLAYNCKMGLIEGGSYGVTDVQDMTMADYSYVVQFLILYLNQNAKHLALRGPKVEGVKVICSGERRATGDAGEHGPHYVPIKLPGSHALLQSFGEVSAISQRVGMPLKFTKCKTAEDHNTSNHAVALMQTCIDPNKKFNIVEPFKNRDGYFGWPKTYWEDNISTVLLTSVDGSPVDVETIEAFTSFCDHVVTLTNRTEEQGYDVDVEYGGRLTDQQALAGITAQKWKYFLAEWKGKKATVTEGRKKDAGDEVKDVVEAMSNVHVDGDYGAGDAVKGEAAEESD